MSSLQYVLSIFSIAIYGVLLFFILPFGTYAIWRDFRRRKMLTIDLKNKLKSGINVDTEVFSMMVKGLEVPNGLAYRAAYKLMSETNDQEMHKKIFDLCKNLDNIEPYANLPADTRLSLSRIKDLINKSDLSSDKYLMEPIINNLYSFENLKSDYSKSKKFTLLVNIIGLFSFAFGIFGLYVSFKTPSIDDIQSVILKSQPSEVVKNANE